MLNLFQYPAINKRGKMYLAEVSKEIIILRNDEIRVLQQRTSTPPLTGQHPNFVKINYDTTIIFNNPLTMVTFASAQPKTKLSSSKSSTVCSGDREAKNKKAVLTCKLATPELRQRKKSVIKSLKSQILTKKELKNGYTYKFAGTDKMVDELAEFVKTERACCDFFVFNLSISGDKTEAWLQITGPRGAKDFIKTELEL